MAHAFIGLPMLVTLLDPPGAQVRGVVSSVVPGKSLTLRNVTAISSGRTLPEYTIPASEIADLVRAGDENARSGSAKQQNGAPKAGQLLPQAAQASSITHAPPRNAYQPHPSHSQQPYTQHAPQPQVQAIRVPNHPVTTATPSFEDPAILSVGRKPTPASRQTSSGQWSATTAMEREDSSRTAKDRRDSIPHHELSIASNKVTPLKNVSLAEVANSPLEYDELEAEVEQEENVPEQESTKRKPRKRKGKKAVGGEGHEVDVVPTKETTKSKGWRKTPLLEPNPSFQPFNSLKRNNRRGKQRIDEAGWATEDASEVQEKEDFDFERSLAKFDKQSVFQKIQAEDSIAEEDRLVSHNRLPRNVIKPGTNGGKNYRYDENVLENKSVTNGVTPKGTPKMKQEIWRSEDDEEERGALRDRDTGSGRQSRRAESKIALGRRPSSRKGSAVIGAASVRSHSIATQPPSSPSLHLIPSDQRCETVSTLQMLNLENIADSEHGLTEDLMTENAGRGIAEIACTVFKPSSSTHNSIPTVIIFAGNHTSGWRAVAAGRHMLNHNVNVVVCVLGIERESELLVHMQRQLKIFRSFAGQVVSKPALLEYLKTLSSPPELIIDGLLGLTISFEELRTGDQATAYELIELANRSIESKVLAIDVPTGIDPTSGKINIIDGRQLYLRADIVVAVAAPKKGLLEAMGRGEGMGGGDDNVVEGYGGVGKGYEDGRGDDGEKGKKWKLFVVDAGLGKAVWKKAGTRIRRGVEFEGSWVLGMRFVGGTE